MNGLESLPQHGAMTANGMGHPASVNNISHVSIRDFFKTRGD